MFFFERQNSSGGLRPPQQSIVQPLLLVQQSIVQPLLLVQQSIVQPLLLV